MRGLSRIHRGLRGGGGVRRVRGRAAPLFLSCLVYELRSSNFRKGGKGSCVRNRNSGLQACNRVCKRTIEFAIANRLLTFEKAGSRPYWQQKGNGQCMRPELKASKVKAALWYFIPVCKGTFLNSNFIYIVNIQTYGIDLKIEKSYRSKRLRPVWQPCPLWAAHTVPAKLVKACPVNLQTHLGGWTAK